jgi:hypothetical protein
MHALADFLECATYAVEPTGEVNYAAGCGTSSCEQCVQMQSRDVLKCRQTLLLAENTVRRLSVENFFCLYCIGLFVVSE